MLEFLKYEWQILGLDAPRFAWVVAFFLIIGTVVFVIRLFRKINLLRQIFSATSEKINLLEKPSRGEGISETDYENLIQTLENEKILQNAAKDFTSTVIVQNDRTGAKRFWQTQSANRFFTEENLTTALLNKNLFQSLPSIITGIGLLTTFLAILVALVDVRIVNTRVEGMEVLIQGLSGKFISSVVALLCATVFALFEKWKFHLLEKSRLDLVNSLDRFMPQISQVQMLVELNKRITDLQDKTIDIKQYSEIQAASLQDFNTAIGEKLKSSLDESMSPTLNRMVKAVEDMNQLLRSSQTNIGASMTSALEEMAESFRKSLSGGAQAQFEGIAETLGNTTKMLETMNSRFSGMQTMMSELIEQAKNSTVEQINLGKNQLVGLKEATEQFMSNLSKQTNNFSAQNATHVREIFEIQSSQFGQIDEIRQTLETTAVKLKDSMNNIGQFSTETRGLLEQINNISISINNLAERTNQTHKNFQMIAEQTEKFIEGLREENKAQAENWKQIRAVMNEYAQTFSGVQNAASNLLKEITTSLEDYQKVSRDGFAKIVEISDKHFANATEKLGASVGELDEVLQDLTETLEKLNGRK